MTRSHDLKTWPEPWEATRAGLKPFEFRRDDRGFAVGDVLNLRYWDPGALSSSGVGRGAYIRDSGFTSPWPSEAKTLRAEVTYVLYGRHGVPDGYVVLGIKMLDDGTR